MRAAKARTPTPSANLGRVRVVRPDAQSPLVVEINFREMIMTGNTTYNIQLRENDIIYVPPTWLGSIGRFIEKLLSPLASVVQAAFGFARRVLAHDGHRGESISEIGDLGEPAPGRGEPDLVQTDKLIETRIDPLHPIVPGIRHQHSPPAIEGYALRAGELARTYRGRISLLGGAR